MFKTFALFLLLAIGPACHVATAAPAPLQDRGAVIKQVEVFLREQASTYPGSVQVTVDASRIQKQPACDELDLFLPSGPRLRPRLSVGVRCATPQRWVAYVRADLSIDGFYYVATRNIKRGVTLSLDDLTAREGDLLSLSANIVFDPSQIIDRITTQRIRAGSPIRSSTLRQPDSIQRGQTVRLLARGRGFVATSEGEALEGGPPGAQIRVRTRSGRVVSGAILNANTVQVVM